MHSLFDLAVSDAKAYRDGAVGPVAPAAAETHWWPYDTKTRGTGRYEESLSYCRRAWCTEASYSDKPTCAECQRLLAHDEANPNPF